MVSVGDRIRLTLNKGASREGVVTGVTGSMLRVRWASDEETSVIPTPGTLTVLGRTRKLAPTTRKITATAKKATSTPAAATKKVPPTKKAPQKAVSSSQKPAEEKAGGARRPKR